MLRIEKCLNFLFNHIFNFAYYTKRHQNLGRLMMKRFLFYLVLILLGIGIGCGMTISILGIPETQDDFVIKVKQETEKYKKECFSQIFPKDLNDIDMYSDEIKELDHNYHQCMRKVIIAKINELATKEDANKMIQSLDKIEEGILNFYWDLYNIEDYGIIGRDMNDASMGRYYETILQDVIHFQRLYRHHSYSQ